MTGCSWNKSPIATILTPPNGSELPLISLTHCLQAKIRGKLMTYVFVLVSLLVFKAVFQASSHLKEG